MKKIGPDEIVATLETDHPLDFEARLLRKYRHARLPESCYFELKDSQLDDCKEQFGVKSKLPKTIDAEFLIAFTGSLILFFMVHNIYF